MTSINFDEASTVTLADSKPALNIINTGRGEGLFGECTGSPSHGVGDVVGVRGRCTSSVGVMGESQYGNGIKGVTKAEWIFDPSHPILGPNPSKIAAVAGIASTNTVGSSYGVAGFINGQAGAAVWGESRSSTGKGIGVYGRSYDVGVHGESETTYGVYGHSRGFDGIKGETHGALAAGVAGYNWGTKGYGIWGSGGEWAGFFQGSVKVTGELQVTQDIRILGGDCAEEFDVCDSETKPVEPGTVMVMTENGSLRSSYQEYDRRVAGVVSGAKGFWPAIILDKKELSPDQGNKDKVRLPIALLGKIYCKADATSSTIKTGDLLTTSSMKGYAMKADDPIKSFGAVIGKALGSLKQGLGMIPVLVTLQ